MKQLNKNRNIKKDKPAGFNTGKLDDGEYTLSWYQHIIVQIPRSLWRRLLNLPAKSISAWHRFSFRIFVDNTGTRIGYDGDCQCAQLEQRDMPSGYIKTTDG